MNLNMNIMLRLSLLMGLLLLSACANAGPVRNRHVLWSEAELTTLRNMPGEIIHSQYERLDDEALWNLMLSTTTKRTHSVNWPKGCPLHGKILHRYAWKLDPIEHPRQVQCPLGKEWYPNENFPDTSDGYKAPDGAVYNFVSYYAFWVYQREIMAFTSGGGDHALKKLTTAYLRTGNGQYAHKAAILLTRIALEMPNATAKRNRCLKGNYGHWQGLISDYVWESRNAGLLARYYDIIRDAIDEDEKLIAFIRTKIPELDSGPKIREYIEDELLRVMAQAIIDETLDGNPGYPQYSGALLAAVLNDFDSEKHSNSRNIMEWLYYGWGQFRFMFSNFLLPDGGGMESLSYSKMMLDLLPTIEVIERYRKLAPDRLPEDRYPDMRHHVKVRKLLDFQIDTWDQGAMLAGIGDCGGNLNASEAKPKRRTDWLLDRLFAFNLGYQWYQDPRYARVLVQDDGTVLGEGPVKPIDAAPLKQAAAKAGLGYHQQTKLLDNYGIAFLRSGTEKNPRTVWLYYGEGRVHHHVDPLNLGLFAGRRDLLPELGYPRNMRFPWRSWESDIWAHNTVIVDEGWPFPPYSYGITHTPHGRVERMHDWRDRKSGLGVQAVQITVPVTSVFQREGAPEISRYRRTVVLVDVSESKSYVVDFFEVAGGREHHLKWSFPEGEVLIEGVTLRARPGTVAGEDVPFASTYKSKRFGVNAINNLSCLENVRRGPAQTPYTATWTCRDDAKTHLRITQLPERETEAIVAEGRHPANRDYYKVTFALARRKGEAPLTSRYATILEPYQDTPCIRKVERLETADSPKMLAVRVTTTQGEDVIVINGRKGMRIATTDIETDAALAVVRKTINGTITGFMSGGTLLAAGDRHVIADRTEMTMRIQTVAHDACEIGVGLPREIDLLDRWLHIGNELRSSTYRVMAQRRDAGERLVLTLDRSALLAEGMVRGTKDGVILNDVQMPIGGVRRGRVVSRMMSGATIQCGKTRYRVKNVEYGNYYTKRSGWNVQIDRNYHPHATKTQLARDFPSGNIFAIYDYAPGDTVTVISDSRLIR